MAKKAKEEKYKDDGITYLEVWDTEMKKFKYKLDINAHFIDIGKED